jgi:hypothetical protein
MMLPSFSCFHGCKHECAGGPACVGRCARQKPSLRRKTVDPSERNFVAGLWRTTSPQRLRDAVVACCCAGQRPARPCRRPDDVSAARYQTLPLQLRPVTGRPPSVFPRCFSLLALPSPSLPFLLGCGLRASAIGGVPLCADLRVCFLSADARRPAADTTAR